MRFLIITFVFLMSNFSFSQKNELRHRVVESEGNYGIIPDNSSHEISLQFDSVPVQLGGSHYNYYCARKDRMWGVIYVSKYSVIDVIPYRYHNVQSIKKDFRSEVPFLYKCGLTQRFDIKYMYISAENTVLKLNSYNSKKDSIVVLTPKIDGKEIICVKEYEYLFAPAWSHTVLVKIEKEKVEALTDYFRKDAAGENINYWGSYDERFTRMRPNERGAKSLVIYDTFDDTLSLIYEFTEESENITYNILLPQGAYCAQYEPYYHGGLHHVLKTTELKNKKYKHEFFKFNGEKVYEIVSKKPITFWTSEEQVFYGNGKRICRFNAKKNTFSR